jgi:hypothetical protein
VLLARVQAAPRRWGHRRRRGHRCRAPSSSLHLLACVVLGS